MSLESISLFPTLWHRALFCNKERRNIKKVEHQICIIRTEMHRSEFPLLLKKLKIFGAVPKAIEMELGLRGGELWTKGELSWS